MCPLALEDGRVAGGRQREVAGAQVTGLGGDLHSTGEYLRAVAGDSQPQGLHSLPRALALNIVKRSKTHKNKRWEGAGGKEEKTEQQKPSINTPSPATPAELSLGKQPGGRAALVPAGHSLKPFGSDGAGATYVHGRLGGVTRGPPPGPRGQQTDWPSASAGPAWTRRAGTVAGSVR